MKKIILLILVFAFGFIGNVEAGGGPYLDTSTFNIFNYDKNIDTDINNYLDIDSFEKYENMYNVLFKYYNIYNKLEFEKKNTEDIVKKIEIIQIKLKENSEKFGFHYYDDDFSLGKSSRNANFDLLNYLGYKDIKIFSEAHWSNIRNSFIITYKFGNDGREYWKNENIYRIITVKDEDEIEKSDSLYFNIQDIKFLKALVKEKDANNFKIHKIGKNINIDSFNLETIFDINDIKKEKRIEIGYYIKKDNFFIKIPHIGNVAFFLTYDDIFEYKYSKEKNKYNFCTLKRKKSIERAIIKLENKSKNNYSKKIKKITEIIEKSNSITERINNIIISINNIKKKKSFGEQYILYKKKQKKENIYSCIYKEIPKKYKNEY